MRIGDVDPERPPRPRGERQPCGECSRLVLALADRIHAAHEVLARLAERRVVVLTERDSCPLG